MTERWISRTGVESPNMDSTQHSRIDTIAPPLPGTAEADIPSVLDVPQAARLLGIGRTLAYELVRTDQWPTPVIRMGRLIKIPSGPLIELMTTGATTQRQVPVEYWRVS
jgi:hypothetical protein